MTPAQVVALAGRWIDRRGDGDPAPSSNPRELAFLASQHPYPRRRA